MHAREHAAERGCGGLGGCPIGGRRARTEEGGDQLKRLRASRRVQKVLVTNGEDGNARSEPVAVEGGPHGGFARHVLAPLARETLVLALRHRVRVRPREHEVPIRVDGVHWRAHEQHRGMSLDLATPAPFGPVALDDPCSTVGDPFARQTKRA